MLEKKKDVYKPPAVIHHDNTNVSLVQKQAYSWLIANAYHELPTEETHSVRIQDLMQVMRYNSKNLEHLKNSLRNLMTTLIEWDIPRYDKENVWRAATMLAEIEIKDGVCSYSFAPKFRRALHHPEIYARLSLALISKFSSKYALNLWEMCVHAMNPKTGVGETQWWEIDEFRKMMGVKEGTYKRFKDLNKWVIKPAAKEIELLAHCEVTPEYQRKRRKTTHIKFKAAKIKNIERVPKQTELFVDTEGLPTVAALLAKQHVHHNKAMKMWSEGYKGVKKRPKGSQEFDDYVREKIDLLQQQVAKGKVEDRGAWLVSAIENNYRNPNYQQRKRASEIQEKIAQLKTEVKRLKYKREKKEAEILNALVADDNNVQSAFEQVKTEPLFKEEWNGYTDEVRKGMRESDFFAALINLAIKGKHFDMFKPANGFDAQIEKVEAEIRRQRATLHKS